MALIRSNKQGRRDAILNAAREVFARDGFQRARMEEIARIAQVGKGTLYEHFGNKDGLFLALCAHTIEENLQRLEEGLRSDGSPRDRLQRLIEGLIESIAGLIPLFGLYFEAWTLAWTRADLRSACIDTFRALYQPLRARIAGLVREGQGPCFSPSLVPEDAASLILAAVDGLAYQGLFLFDPSDFPRLAKEVAQILLSGLDRR